MADRPIIFSGPMVRALIEGRKTQTRRVMKPQPDAKATFQGLERDGQALFTVGCFYGKLRLPYAPGDRLYVREAWTARMTHGWTIADARSRMFQEEILYRADGHESYDGWWPSIHMPREFSRLTLTVTEVRVQRLQEISEADARAEGASMKLDCSGFLGKDAGWSMDWSRVGEMSAYAHRKPGGPAKAPLTEKDISLCDARMAFASYWNSLHGSDAWDANPWVVALAFTVQHGNIDKTEGDR